MYIKPVIALTVLFALISYGLSQQLGTDNITWIEGTTTLDFSRSLPAAVLCAGAVILQALNISFFLLTFSREFPKKEEKPKDKPKEEKPGYGKEEKEKPKDEKPKETKEEKPDYVQEQISEEKPSEEQPAEEQPVEEKPEYGQTEEKPQEESSYDAPQETGYDAPQETGYAAPQETSYEEPQSNYVKPNNYYRFKRVKRSVEEENMIDMLKSTEEDDCYSRLICSMATGHMVTSKFDILPEFFSTEEKFDPNEFAYKYNQAAILGKSSKSIHLCEIRYGCPMTQKEFSSMLWN